MRSSQIIKYNEDLAFLTLTYLLNKYNLIVISFSGAEKATCMRVDEEWKCDIGRISSGTFTMSKTSYEKHKHLFLDGTYMFILQHKDYQEHCYTLEKCKFAVKEGDKIVVSYVAERGMRDKVNKKIEYETDLRTIKPIGVD